MTAAEVLRFVRATALGGTFTPVLAGLGSAAVRPDPPGDLLLMTAVALAFHVFAYVLNDVVDLPLDRGEPRRRTSPLVTGRASPRAALVVALAALPVGFLAARGVSGDADAMLALLVAYAAMACYDLWGKRCPFPPLTDAVQALSWASLLWWGAAAAGGTTATTFWLAGCVALLILLANGVHGPLRDLDNDLRFGARTTAILLGARPRPGGGVTATPALTLYATTLHAAVLAAAVAALVVEPRTSAGSAAGVVAVGAVSTVLAVRGVRDLGEAMAMRHAGLLHLAVLLLLPLVVVAPRLDPATAAAAAVAFTAPLAAHSWLPGALRSLVPVRAR